MKQPVWYYCVAVCSFQYFLKRERERERERDRRSEAEIAAKERGINFSATEAFENF